ncbi:MAG TPA: hypothetical protein ENM98_05815 [Halothiobacillaceae bacterium]|nr:hypothetical protein [Halothiobacillaceae bacterium]
MKRLIFLIALIAAGMVAVTYYFPDRAMANLEIAGWQLQTTAMGLFIAVVALLLVLWVIFSLLRGLGRLPERMRLGRQAERRRKADDQLLRAFAERAQQKPDAAIKAAMTQIDDASMPPLHHLFAIDAQIDALIHADAKVREERGLALEQQLEQVQKNFPKFAHFLRLHVGQRLLDVPLPELAEQVLKPVFKAKPKDPAVLRLKLGLFQAQQDHAAIAELIPALRRHRLPDITPTDLANLEERAFLGQMNQAVADNDIDRLSRQWARANPQIAASSKVVRAYANALNRIGSPVSAAKVLEKRMAQNLDVELLHDWAELAHDDMQAASERLANLVPDAFNQPRQANADPSTSMLRSAYAYAQATVLLAANKADQARNWLGKIESLDHDWRYLKIAARVHCKLKDNTEACILFKRALDKLNVAAAGIRD